MVVQKVSVNTPYQIRFGAGDVAQAQQTSPVKPHKDYTKAIGWAAAGLATAGIAGILIYKARKGNSSGASDALVGVGTFARKFLDESIFAKTTEQVQNGSSEIMLRVSEDKNDWQMCNLSESFGCHLVKKVPTDKTDVPNFEFGSRPLKIKFFNKDSENAKFDFILGELEDVHLSVDIEPWRGKVKGCSLKDNTQSYNLLNEQSQKLIDELDFEKFINDENYRVNYTSGLFSTVGQIIRKDKFQAIATKSGKTFDEVCNLYGSKEFSNLLDVRGAFAVVHSRYNLGDSAIYASMKDKDEFGLLEDLASGKSKINIIDDFVETDVHLPENKTCFEVSIPTEDGTSVIEHLRMSKDKEYLLYERFNPQDTSDIMRIKCYYPLLTEENHCITDIETKGASLFLETTLSGTNRVNITHPTSGEMLKFSFNSNREWNEGLDYGDELQPYMNYIEKIAKLFSDEVKLSEFLSDFPVKGREMLEEFAK